MGRKVLGIIGLIYISFFSFSKGYNEEMLEKIKKGNFKGENFSFVVLGDNRGGDEIFKKIIEAGNKDPEVKFFLNNGDLAINGSTKNLVEYKKEIQNSEKPIISIIGNHESKFFGIIPLPNRGKNYKEIFGERYFSFTYGNSYFVVLDTSNEKRLDTKQEEWMLKELENSKKYKNRFVLTHVPLFDPRKGEYKKGHSLGDLNYAKKLNKIFDEYNVTMLFTSHIHFFYEGKWGKTPYFISGGGGAPLKNFKDNGFYHYIKVMVNGSDVEFKVVKILN